jgi:DNA polymerase-4
LGQLAGLPAGAVLNQLGASGRLLHQLARGRDNRPVVGRCPEAVEVATRQLEGPVAERAILEAVFQSMTVELADRLRADGLAARTVWLTLHLDDRTACRQQLVLRHPTGTPERLARVLTELLAQARLRSGVVELEVGLVDLVPAVGQQLDLFAHGLEQGSRLREALKDLVARYGPECFYRISLPNPEARLPERRFRLERIDRP